MAEARAVRPSVVGKVGRSTRISRGGDWEDQEAEDGCFPHEGT